MTAQGYALVEYKGDIYCSERNNLYWDSVKLRGSLANTMPWVEAVNELNNRIGLENELTGVRLYLIVEDHLATTFLEISKKLIALNASEVSLYPTSWMLKSFGREESIGPDLINKFLLEQVSNPGEGYFNQPDSVNSEDLEETETQAYCEQLQADLAEQKLAYDVLSKDNSELRRSIDYLRRRLDSQAKALCDERLNSYLTCIFNNYWGNVSRDDHCIYTDQVNRPILSSPVTEPSDICIRQVAKEVSRLSSVEKVELQKICLRLVQACSELKVRHEFEYLLDEQMMPTARGVGYE